MSKLNSTKTLKDFSYLVGIGIPLIFGFVVPKLTGHEFRSWTLFIGLPILIIGFFAPNKLLYPYKVWMKIGHILGWINSKIILGLVFLLVLQPIAIVMRLSGYDPLKLKVKNTKTFKESKNNTKIDLSRTF